MKYQDLIEACQSDWQEYTQHDFVQQLAKGTLDQHSFLHYLKQDFLFLKQYARAYALAIYKARTLEDMRRALPSVHALLDSEIGHHVTYCGQWGLTESDLENEPEDFGTVAYTRYVLDAGMTGDLVDLYAALAPCSIGYAVIGKALIESNDTVREGNPYASWIELYGGEEFQSGVAQGAEHFNQLLEEIDLHSQRGQNLIEVFRTATRMEVAFWQQGLDAK
ncbi:thiaminase II [Vibrio coralliilyticus]|uniref:thiaminase II n=1 Tax=Vibrio coralliilyticus TaxID=190893 RepID=UPI000BAAB524|nr:thiaminase II [Vibrio coralliilyticus]NRF29666.1 thiaminase II [Vibrio coralliilyticus]NRF52182.1 thiaminase II [Vibrio coralliilyticus]NRG06104.1 thiaminase II [Vibrio coralliilyticus]PAU40310.1 thiaminase II [Vibrio coralliilyticus]WFB50873.1 thiaminase II [Vibrio coralliilyticus]